MSNVQQEICPFCGKVTRTDGNFCTECGHKIEGIFNSQMANRAKINTKENERDEEVENLKATFNRIESYKGEYKEVNSYGRKEGKKRIYIVVSLLAIFVIVFIVIKLNVSSPKKVAEKYIKALMTENGDDFISVTVPKKMVGKICSKTGMTRKRIATSVEYEISDYDIDSFTIVEKTESNSEVERYAYSMLSELDSGITYNYKGRTYKATRTLRIEYGSWSGESENYVAESDTRHVHTRSKTDTTESESTSLNGWTRTGERKVYTGEWESGHRRDTEMPSDTGDAEWWLDYTDYHYWHYHNKYPEGGGGIDSIGINSYGKCEFYSAAEGKQASDAPDKGGRGYGYCGLEEYHHCPYNWTAYWREKNYIYKRRPYKKIYTYSRTYTIYSYCDIRYYY